MVSNLKLTCTIQSFNHKLIVGQNRYLIYIFLCKIYFNKHHTLKLFHRLILFIYSICLFFLSNFWLFKESFLKRRNTKFHPKQILPKSSLLIVGVHQYHQHSIPFTMLKFVLKLIFFDCRYLLISFLFIHLLQTTEACQSLFFGLFC